MPDLLTELRNHLVTASIVRNPNTAGALPPMWLEPKIGTPAPGEIPARGTATNVGATAVLAAYWSGGVAPSTIESFLRTDFVELRLRTTAASVAQTLEAAIRNAVIDTALGYGKRNWTMGTTTIIESLVYRPMDRLGSDEQSFDWSMELLFVRYA